MKYLTEKQAIAKLTKDAQIRWNLDDTLPTRTKYITKKVIDVSSAWDFKCYQQILDIANHCRPQVKAVILQAVNDENGMTNTSNTWYFKNVGYNGYGMKDVFNDIINAIKDYHKQALRTFSKLGTK